jgi:uncharacterized membrane protein
MFLTAEATPASARTRWRALGWALPLLAVVLAACVRLPHLGRHGYDLDEAWTAEVSRGAGSPHATLPTDRLLSPAPNLTRLTADAPPFWHVWTHLAITQPPLYQVLLRLWQDVVGTGDGRERAFSLVASVAAVLVLHDAVRLRSGRWPAFWAAALMAASVPQVEYARLTRPYALLTLLALAMADAATRIEVLGPTRRRGLALAGTTAATLLSHYFAVAPVAAVALYAALCLGGRARRVTLLSVGIGAAVFAAAWLPWVPGQLYLFKGDDVGTDFLRHDLPHHGWHTLLRVALMPVTMLFTPTPSSEPFAAAGAVLYALPLLFGRRPSGLSFWGIWLCSTVGLLAALDLSRGTTHLAFVRYALLAGPAVFAILPTVLAAATRGSRAGLGWAAHAVPAAAVVAALAALPYDAFSPERADPHELAETIVPRLSADDLLVFATPPRNLQFAGGLYLMADRYLGPLPCPIVVLTAPATPAVVRRIDASRQAWLITDVGDARPYLPGVHVRGGELFPGIGMLWHLAKS